VQQGIIKDFLEERLKSEAQVEFYKRYFEERAPFGVSPYSASYIKD
jgi:hypothetical protein